MTVFAGLLAAAITINPGSYTGRYFVDAFPGSFSHGATTVDLAVGTHTIDLGANIGSSGFSFTVDAVGNVINVAPASAASASGASLTFNTVSISIDPNGFTGTYFLSVFGTDGPLTGPLITTLAPGLTYALDDGANIGGSSFLFALDSVGKVINVAPAAATGIGSTLQFNTVSFTIDPGAFSCKYGVAPFGETTLFTGVNHFALLPLLTYSLDDGSFIGGSALQFQVPAGGGTLTLANVAVTLDPGTYLGSYSVANCGTFSGVASLVLLPNLICSITVAGQTLTFTPSAAGVSPSSLSFTAATFGFTAPAPPQLISTLLSSGQITSSGIAQSLSGAFSRATTLASLQRLQARIDHELATGKITQSAHDALTAEVNALIAGL